MKKKINNSLNYIQLKTFNFLKEKKDFLSSFLLICDAPDFWQLRLQDPASSIMEGILMFNKHLLFIIVIILLVVSWLLFNTIYSYEEFNSSNSAQFFHSNELEIIWTSLPALTLLTLASPSFSLLYSMDEISIPDFWQLRLQDPASSIMEGILMFNKHLLFIIVIILLVVSWLLFNTRYGTRSDHIKSHIYFIIKDG